MLSNAGFRGEATMRIGLFVSLALLVAAAACDGDGGTSGGPAGTEVSVPAGDAVDAAATAEVGGVDAPVGPDIDDTQAAPPEVAPDVADPAPTDVVEPAGGSDAADVSSVPTRERRYVFRAIKIEIDDLTVQATD